MRPIPQLLRPSNALDSNHASAPTLSGTGVAAETPRIVATEKSSPRRVVGLAGAAVLSLASIAALTPTTSAAAAAPTSTAAGTYSSDTQPPDVTSALANYATLWRSSGNNDLHGTVVNATVMQWDDRVASWINQNATPQQQFRALQDSTYDQSATIADGMGSTLGRYYIEGRIAGALPLVTALVNTVNGTSGAYVSTSAAKYAFSHPRPYLAAAATSLATAGDAPGCSPAQVNASSQTPIRLGKPWVNADGSLKITRVPDTIDTTHALWDADVPMSAYYGLEAICAGGSFPSGHTTSAYQAGITFATLLPELAPGILARTSEAANNRIVLGVHYPLDIIGGRIAAEAATAARWSDPTYRHTILEPARAELITYLEHRCGTTLATCIAHETPYTNTPYTSAAGPIPGGTAQTITASKNGNKNATSTATATAVAVYTERLTYGFPTTASTKLAPAVPPGADNLLLTTYPTLTPSQRREILAATQTPSGDPLDTTTGDTGSWERLNLAAAMTATIRILPNGRLKITTH